jgi:hypothetical protein
MYNIFILIKIEWNFVYIAAFLTFQKESKPVILWYSASS